MTRAEALRQIAELHRAWALRHGDSVPYEPVDAAPHHVGQATDLAIWQADRSAPADVDDPLNAAIKTILGQIED